MKESFKVSYYDEASGGGLKHLIASSEDRRNELMQKLVDKGLSPTYRPLPSNMTEDEEIALINDALQIFTLTTSVNKMTLLAKDIVECTDHMIHGYVFGVEIILFNEFVITETMFPPNGILQSEPVYPENVEEIIRKKAMTLLDSVGFDYSHTQQLVNEGKFSVDALLGRID